MAVNAPPDSHTASDARESDYKFCDASMKHQSYEDVLNEVFRFALEQQYNERQQAQTASAIWSSDVSVVSSQAKPMLSGVHSNASASYGALATPGSFGSRCLQQSPSMPVSSASHDFHPPLLSPKAAAAAAATINRLIAEQQHPGNPGAPDSRSHAFDSSAVTPAAAAVAVAAISQLQPSVLGSPVHGPPGGNVFVFHIPNQWTERELAACFCCAGQVLSVRIATDRNTGRGLGFGFVSYGHVASACIAVQAFNGFTIAGKRLKVTIKRGEQRHAAAFIASLPLHEQVQFRQAPLADTHSFGLPARVNALNAASGNRAAPEALAEAAASLQNFLSENSATQNASASSVTTYPATASYAAVTLPPRPAGTPVPSVPGSTPQTNDLLWMILAAAANESTPASAANALSSPNKDMYPPKITMSSFPAASDPTLRAGARRTGQIYPAAAAVDVCNVSPQSKGSVSGNGPGSGSSTVASQRTASPPSEVQNFGQGNDQNALCRHSMSAPNLAELSPNMVFQPPSNDPSNGSPNGSPPNGTPCGVPKGSLKRHPPYNEQQCSQESATGHSRC